MILLDKGDTTLLDTYATYLKQLSNPQNPVFATSSTYSTAQNGLYKFVRVLGHAVPNWWNSWDWSVDTAASASFINYSLTAYHKNPAKTAYLDMAVVLGEYLLDLQDNDGGIRMGPIGMYHPSGPAFYWNLKSTEQNERCLFALESLYEITGKTDYNMAANALKGWLKSMYDASSHLYHTSSVFNGTAWVPEPLDYISTNVIAFAPLSMMFTDPFFGSTQEDRDHEVDAMFNAIEQLTAFHDLNGQPKLFRFSLSQTGDYGSVEWSSQMSLAYLRVAQNYTQRSDGVLTNIQNAGLYLAKYSALVQNLGAFFTATDTRPLGLTFQSPMVAPYASYLDHSIAGNVPTGTGYNTFNCGAALASAYYAFALAGYDPMDLDGGTGIPIIPPPDFTPPSTPTVTAYRYYSVDNGTLAASWQSSDPESGIAEYQYRILDATAGPLLLRDWTSTQQYTSITAGALPLVHGRQYYFEVKALNKAGTWSDRGVSNMIVENAPPASNERATVPARKAQH
jgi:hypothetical protein